MNVVREISKINERELELGVSGSWHDEYKDSAYIFIGGLNFELTEGDVIAIFSQYGEVMDVNLPRDKNTGKTRGFGFLMYEDQRSTVLAVDNLNGAKVLEKTLRVDHVKNYKQPGAKGEDGEWREPEEQSLNAKPKLIMDDHEASDSDASSAPSIDPEDPMRDYLLAQRKEEKARKKTKKSKSSKDKRKDETPEERKARKERKKEKKARKLQVKSEGMRGVEELLSSLGRRDRDEDREAVSRNRTPPSRRRSLSRSSRSPVRSRGPRVRSRSPIASGPDYRDRSSTRNIRGDDNRHRDSSRQKRRTSRDYD